jgi:hypothetical protein
LSIEWRSLYIISLSIVEGKGRLYQIDKDGEAYWEYKDYKIAKRGLGWVGNSGKEKAWTKLRGMKFHSERSW